MREAGLLCLNSEEGLGGLDFVTGCADSMRDSNCSSVADLWPAMIRRMGARTAAITCQLALLVYFEVCLLVPLGAWNDQPAMRASFNVSMLILPLAIGVGQLLLLLGSWKQIRWLMWIGLLADSLWLASHIASLWMPYLRGASPQYAAMYARVFSDTTKLLPSHGNHLAPDGMHIVLDVLLLLVILMVAGQLRAMRATAERGPV